MWWQATVFAILPCVGPAAGQVVDPALWTCEPGGTVTATARVGNTLYFAGSFYSVGPPSGAGVPVSMRDGAPLSPYPKVAGRVEVALADGEGGWYIGGAFTGVGGLPRPNLAHILSNGTVADWDPSPNEAVRALALKGVKLYVGGDFTSMEAGLRRGVAEFDVKTGTMTAWDPQSDYRVSAIVVRNNTVYVGGTFTRIGGQSRNHLAALDAYTGRATAWDPSADAGVQTLLLHGNTLYAGGEFFHIGGQLRKYLAAVDIATGKPTTWNPGVDRVPDYLYDGGPRVSALSLGHGSLYVAGSFNRIGGQRRAGLAAFDLQSAVLNAWDPQATSWGWNPTPHFNALAIHGSKVYVGGGAFTSLGGRVSDHYGGDFAAAVDPQTGQAVDWNPRPNQEVNAFAVSGNVIYVGGLFSSMGDWVQRLGLAALDLTSGAATPWNPEPDGIVRSLAVNGTTVYVAGAFSYMGGELRANIAALDGTLGKATAWNPGANGALWALAISDSTLYVGGWFSRIGGQPRANIAALETVTDAVTAWNPGANDIVEALVASSRRVYVGGQFSRMGGQRRIGIAAVDAVSGAVLAWNPNPDSHLNALAVDDGTVYAGGTFQNIGGQARYCLAALDTSTGAATSWSADLDQPGSSGFGGQRRIAALAVSGGVVYAGGAFGEIDGQRRTCLAAIDAKTADVLSWNPDPNAEIWSLAVYGDRVYAGGSFVRMGLSPSTNLAAINAARAVRRKLLDAQPLARLLGPIGLDSVTPNPVRTQALIRFSLPTAKPVNLAIYDVQGRRVATILHNAVRPASHHEVSVRTNGWPEGFYYCRIDAGSASAIQKFVVLR